MRFRVDLYSDTMTRPTAAMREAIANAEVGDEQRFEDPTTNALQDRVAALLGKERALFLPSGAMCNQIAYRVHCQPGDEIILDENSHPRHFEVGAAAALSGAQLYPLAGRRGIFTAQQVREAIRNPGFRNFPRTRCISLEQTTNMGGGVPWPLETIAEISAVAREHGITMHIDGARLFNAAVRDNVAPRDYAKHVDTLWIDLSKGLGCPVGAVLAGTSAFIEQAWRFKQQFGGAMRQSGILAAAGLYALDHHIERLAEDHANAQALAEGLRGIPTLDVEQPETNMVFFGIARTGMNAWEFEAKVAERGVRIGGVTDTRVRCVTHLDVSRAGIDEAIAAIRWACGL